MGTAWAALPCQLSRFRNVAYVALSSPAALMQLDIGLSCAVHPDLSGGWNVAAQRLKVAV